MTNQEAINYLKEVRKTIELETVCPFGYYSDSVPYIDLAIKALEREEGCENKSDWAFECSNCGAKLDDCKTTIYHKDKAEYPYFNYCPNCGRKVEK